MGWSSFVIPVTVNNTIEDILKIIVAHNNSDIGEELEMVVLQEITKSYKNGILRNCTQAILCGNGGGGRHTYKYFWENKCPIDSYKKSMDKRFGTSKEYLFDDLSNKFICLADFLKKKKV